ncbi:hypothetical protein DID78_00415 [Candidatus Marinamargulisbacteria bacterium SCGC AG-343-D04]|nr:hypothetical protein DID78_00415 [Candidatus Marinamargulisbacteria bacterium SCGC AG-343-D04]
MKRILFTIIFFSWSSILLSSVFDSQIDFFKIANEKNEPFPVLSEKHSFIPYSSAYQFQKEWVAYLETLYKKTGYKAGLTSASSQKKFNTNTPIFGVLVPERIYYNFDIIPISEYQHLFVEAEIGFVIGRDITTPIKTLSTLKRSVASIVAVAELPDIKFSDLNSFQLVDLIMINSGSNTYVVGQEIDMKQANNIDIEFKRNDEVLYTESSNTVMNDQFVALHWLVNELLSHGWSLKKGDLLITGAIGSMIPAKKGRYVINYGDETSLVFDLR